MRDSVLNDVAEQILATGLPVDPNFAMAAAERVLAYYDFAPTRVALPAEEVADRIAELWGIWLSSHEDATKELRNIVREAVAADEAMAGLANNYFSLIGKLEEKCFMGRQYAIALVGCAPLIRTLVSEQRLGLDRIRNIINVSGATFDAIKSVLSAIGIAPAFDTNDIDEIRAADIADVSGYFGDLPSAEADSTFISLLGSFPRSSELGEDVCELVYIGYAPYLFMLYFEFLTLERCDRFPGQAIYECGPRGTKVKALWNSMYHPSQENPYLNNAKSVYSLDSSWAETKLSRETQNGSLLLSDIFEIMAELPYSTRRRVAHVVRCYLTLVAGDGQKTTPLPEITKAKISQFVKRVSASNSLTKGVLDQRLVDFLTMCVHDSEEWIVRGIGSSVNESNAAGRKYGDVEYLSMADRVRMVAYEAHGGGLRDEYVRDHIHSLTGTVQHHVEAARERGEDYRREVEVVYVAHDITRLDSYHDGHTEEIHGVPFTFRFITLAELVEEAGGTEVVSARTDLFESLVHRRISRLPDAYSLKQRYCELITTEI